MKKIFTFIVMAAAMLMFASCTGKLENPTVKNLIGTWDLVSTETVFADGTTTTVNATGVNYITITDSEFVIGDEKTQTTYSFAFKDNHLIVEGTIRYDLVSLTRNEMVLGDKLIIPFLVSEQKLTYKRR